MKRTLKDRDIARMSALKSAVELTAAFHDDVAASGEAAAEVAIRAADKFYKWIFQPAQGNDRIDQDDDDERTNWLELVMKECQQLQTKLGLKPTDFAKDACPWGDWENGGAAALLDTLRVKAKNGKPNGKPNNGNGSKSGRGKAGLEALAEKSGYADNGWSSVPADKLPISKAQYGYAVSLHKKLSIDYDPDVLNSLTSDQASSIIDELKAKVGSNSDVPF